MLFPKHWRDTMEKPSDIRFLEDLLEELDLDPNQRISTLLTAVEEADEN